MSDVRYPWGYNQMLVTMDRLKELARFDLLESEMAERIEAWLVSRQGFIGIGSGYRSVQPDKPGFAPDGESFHQLQTFTSGLERYCAFDLVCRNASSPHRAPRWDEVPKQGSGHQDIKDYGVHCNTAGEPWHMQPIEIDGWGRWVQNGRPHPNGYFPIKGSTPPAPTPTPPTPPGDNIYEVGTRILRVAAPTMRGSDVLWVQNVLSKQGLIISVDGYYGRQTADRVKTMQGWNNLTQDGIVGPKTWKVLKEY